MKRFTPMLAAALVSAVLPAAELRAETPSVNFDQSIDVAGILKDARAEAAQPEAAPIAAVQVGATRYDSDCVTFRFGPNDPLQSEGVWLNSREWVEECTYQPNPPHGGGRQCWERPGYSYRERVQVTLRERKPLLPWQSDAFRVCLQGPWIDVDELENGYDYSREGGDRNGNIVMVPGRRLLTRPDSSGIPGSLSAGLKLALADRWASYYAGEKVTFKLKLRKDVPNWFDSTLLEKEFTFPTAESYSVDFQAFAKDFAFKPEAGKKYYVEAQFRREGSVSKSDWVKAPETDRAVYSAGVLGLGR